MGYIHDYTKEYIRYEHNYVHDYTKEVIGYNSIEEQLEAVASGIKKTEIKYGDELHVGVDYTTTTRASKYSSNYAGDRLIVPWTEIKRRILEKKEGKIMGIQNKVKMKVNSRQSEDIQNIVKANGGGWADGDVIPSLCDKPYLYISGQNLLTYNISDAAFADNHFMEVNADTWIYDNSGKTYSNVPTHGPTTSIDESVPEPVIEPAKVKVAYPKVAYPKEVYKNPKPKQKNVEPIFVGDFVVVDGLEIPRRVYHVYKDTGGVSLKFDEGDKVNKEKVYPIHKLKDGVEPKIGDIAHIELSEDYLDYWCVLKSKKAIEKHTKEGNIYKLYRRTPSLADTTVKRTYKRYSCGTIWDKSNMEVVPSTELGCVSLIEDIAQPYSLARIAEYYNMKTEDLRPKDEVVYETLLQSLDHPLNVKDKEWALIVGPSGSGKTELAVKYAKERGKEYVKQQGTAQLQVDDLLGYKSITTGEYFTSLLREAVEEGKTFILDEIDACNPNTLLVLNGLKQEYFQFPDALVKVHEDFRMIGTANTLQYSEEYNGRQPLDRATLKRFCIIVYELKAHEIALRYGLDETKDLQLKSSNDELYAGSDYSVQDDYTLKPRRNLDPRDIQRIVRMKKIQEG